MDDGARSNETAQAAVYDSNKSSRSPTADDGSEQGQSSNKYRKVDRAGSRSSTASENASRFLFVDSSSTGQRPRSDQRAINAHIQQTAHRNRKQATQKRQTTGTANIGRNRRTPVLQPRPTVSSPSSRISPNLDQQHGYPEAPLSPSTTSSPSRSDTVSFPSSRATPEPVLPSRSRSPPIIEQEQFNRLRHYSTFRRPEIGSAITAQRSEQQLTTIEHVGRTNPEDETSSMKAMLAQILQRLDAGHGGHSIPGFSQGKFNNTVLDPFNISSVYITPSMNTALRHFSEVMIPSIFPTRQQADIQTNWAFQAASQDPLVLYSLLAVASAERSARLGDLRSGSIETTFTEADLENRTVPDFVSYKLKAVKIANESMKSFKTAAQASTIFAMMCLLSIEVITGNEKETFAHVSGLQKLIAWRGGYHGIPPHATELILSSSYMSAAMTRTLPTAPPTSALPSLPAKLVEEIRHNISRDVKKMGTGILNPEVDSLLDWRISQAFRDMREVVQYREHYHETQVLPVQEENDYINAKSYQFRYAVLSAPFESRAPASVKEEACRLALLIFWFSNYQVTAPDSGLNRTLTTQLKTALQASELKSLWGPFYELLTWVLMLGAFISGGQRERPWFVMNLAKVSKVLKLEDWTEVRELLVKFFYLERIYEKGMRAIWDEASLLAESLD